MNNRNFTANCPATELAILGPILIGEPECLAWQEIDTLEAMGLSAESFSSPCCREVWRVILGLKQAGSMTAEKFIEALNQMEILGQTLSERIGWQGEAWLMGIAATMASNAKEVMTVKARSNAVELAGDMATRSSDPSITPEEIVSEFEIKLREVSAKSFDSVDAKDSACDELDREIEAKEKGEKGRGLATGMKVWDNSFGGLLPSHFYILASRPGCGKTALSEQIIDSMLSQGHPVLNFQRELSPFRAVGRMAARKADIAWSDFEKGKLNPAELMRLKTAVNAYRKYPLIQADVTICNGPLIHSLILRHHRINKIKLVVLDYIQIVDIPKGGDERTAIGEMSRHLRLASNETGIPIIAIAQLNREQEKGDRKPKLSDLKSCGALEQDADAVLGLWAAEDREGKSRWSVNWSIMKNRSGALGDTAILFDGPSMSFLGEVTNRPQP